MSANRYDPFGQCAYCNNRILWIRTKNSKNMPCNPQMISYRMPQTGEKATDKIVTCDGEVLSAVKVHTYEEHVDGTGYISHFATCPKMRNARRK